MDSIALVLVSLLTFMLTLLLVTRLARTKPPKVNAASPALFDLSYGSSESPQTPCPKIKNYRFAMNFHLLSPAERNFLGVLDAALGPEFRIFAKVRVGDMLRVQANSRGDWQAGFNTISAKHFDYVVCRTADCAILFAVELDDSSHNRPDRQVRDQLLDDACNEAGLPLHRFRVQRTYSVQAVKKQLLQLPFAA